MLAKKPPYAMQNIEYIKSEYPSVKILVSDVREADSVKKAARDADLLVHLAAQTAVTTSIANPRLDFEMNVLGTFNVLEAARLSHHDPVILYSSTNKVYGDNVNRIPIVERETRYEFKEGFGAVAEDTPTDLCAHSPYGSSKLAGDIYMQDYAKVYGLKTGIMRMSCIYGTRQFGVEDQGWIAWFSIATILGKKITIFGDGKQVRDALYVEDLISAFDCFAISAGRNAGEVFNIGGGSENTLSVLELLDMLKQLTGITPKVRHSEWRPADQKVYISNIGKARNRLGWTPKIGVREGVRRMVSWIEQNGHLFC